jgi:hypothetical protein
VVTPCSLVLCIAGHVRSVAERMAVTSVPGDGKSPTEAAVGCVRYLRGQACRRGARESGIYLNCVDAECVGVKFSRPWGSRPVT